MFRNLQLTTGHLRVCPWFKPIRAKIRERQAGRGHGRCRRGRVIQASTGTNGHSTFPKPVHIKNPPFGSSTGAIGPLGWVQGAGFVLGKFCYSLSYGRPFDIVGIAWIGYLMMVVVVVVVVVWGVIGQSQRGCHALIEAPTTPR